MNDSVNNAANGAANGADEHLDVGAYALGVLDPRDAAHFEAHLATCARCAYRLAELSPLPDLLAEIAPGPAGPAGPLGPPGGPAPPAVEPPPALLDRLLERIAAVRRRQRRRRWALAAVVALLLAGGPAVTAALTAQEQQREQRPAPAYAASAKALFDRGGERLAATDADTGADAAVALWERPWGTEVALRLSGVAGPQSCDLVAVSRDGGRQTVTTWSVPASGYGDTPLYTVGGTGIERSDIERFEIRTLDGRHLVTLPAA
ncbi:MAG TPA: zf-HC2 domain-containing protein [Streptomyces sp.]|uniref:zf-HC2 domain-containing protein n=1 Tax=Streptomyces sp. TaxID=1931 RepID=UPI002D637388|nr:zf-HC2 domain-containing protein [Streptomyces sp.]HZG04758.1 zf-HC2 domain-containing protein [Streptomyces sp.]